MDRVNIVSRDPSVLHEIEVCWLAYFHFPLNHLQFIDLTFDRPTEHVDGWIIHLSTLDDISGFKGVWDRLATKTAGLFILVCKQDIYLETIMLAREVGVRFVLPERFFSDKIDLNIFTQGLEGRTPIHEALENEPGGQFATELKIRNRNGCQEAQKCWQGLLKKCFDDSSKIHDGWLICEELVNNGIIHGIENSPKPDPVVVRMGYWEDLIWISVRDSHGGLTAHRILDKILIHMDEQGIRDTSGRGLFLCYRLSKRLVFHLCEDNWTEVTVFTGRDDGLTSGPFQPMMIFEHNHRR